MNTQTACQDWEEAEEIVGRLTKINKVTRTMTIERAALPYSFKDTQHAIAQTANTELR